MVCFARAPARARARERKFLTSASVRRSRYVTRRLGSLVEMLWRLSQASGAFRLATPSAIRLPPVTRGADQIGKLTIPELIHEPGVTMSARDEVNLVADVYRPRTDRPVPALLQRTPYGRRWSVTEAYAHPYWYVSRGYAVVCQDCRGCGDSAGDFDPFVNEGADGHDTIEWIAQASWCDGRVAMYGFSYPGVAQLLAAAEKPQHLRAIAPAMATSSVRDPWVYRGGALQLAWIMRWICDLGMTAAARAGDAEAAARFASLASDPLRLFGATPVLEALDRELLAFVPFLEQWLAGARDDSYWDRLSPRYSEIALPALHVGGWYDVFLSGTMDSYARLQEAGQAPQSLLIGPWPHIPWQRLTGAVDFGDGAGTSIDEVQRQFFDRWCMGNDEGGLGSPYARLFTMGDNQWREQPSWRASDAEIAPLYLASAGRANSLAGDGTLFEEPIRQAQAPDVFVSDPFIPVTDAGGRSCCYPEVTPMGPADQRAVEQRMDVLVFETDPLTAALLVLGAPRRVVFVASDRPSTDLVARICDVGPDGRSINVSDGNLRFDCREGTQQVDLLMSPTAIRFLTGHRIRLDIAGTSFPTLDRNPGTGAFPSVAKAEEFVPTTIAVFHDQRYPSRIELPLAGQRSGGWRTVGSQTGTSSEPQR